MLFWMTRSASEISKGTLSAVGCVVAGMEYIDLFS